VKKSERVAELGDAETENVGAKSAEAFSETLALDPDVGTSTRLGVAIVNALTVCIGESVGEGLQAYGTRLNDVSRHPLTSQMSATKRPTRTRSSHGST
jgi:hypothetical protein